MSDCQGQTKAASTRQDHQPASTWGTGHHGRSPPTVSARNQGIMAYELSKVQQIIKCEDKRTRMAKSPHQEAAGRTLTWTHLSHGSRNNQQNVKYNFPFQFREEIGNTGESFPIYKFDLSFISVFLHNSSPSYVSPISLHSMIMVDTLFRSWRSSVSFFFTLSATFSLLCCKKKKKQPFLEISNLQTEKSTNTGYHVEEKNLRFQGGGRQDTKKRRSSDSRKEMDNKNAQNPGVRSRIIFTAGHQRNPRHPRHRDASRTTGRRERPHGGGAPRPGQGPGHWNQLDLRGERGQERQGHCDGERGRRWKTGWQDGLPETENGQDGHGQVHSGRSPWAGPGGDGGDVGGGSGCGQRHQHVRQGAGHGDCPEDRDPADGGHSRNRREHSCHDRRIGRHPRERQGGEEALRGHRHRHRRAGDERKSRRVSPRPNGPGCTSARRREIEKE
jgi:hypothetical protein